MQNGRTSPQMAVWHNNWQKAKLSIEKEYTSDEFRLYV